LREAPRKKFDRAKSETADQFVHATIFSALIDNFLLVRLSIAARRNAADIIFGNDAVPDIAGAVEDMQIVAR
jgi:hypothetical protein